jgi:23S rRNA (uridine2552-2'-O)-methyltransferase
MAKGRGEGYRARSAYKLLQIQERFHILHRGDTVLDLGAAPGSWSQVATSLVGHDGLVIAVDLQPIEPIGDVLTIQGDMTSAEVQEELARTAGGPVDVVLSDAAPNASGIRLRDHAFSIALVYAALGMAQHLLRPGGSLVAKVFEGEDFAQLLVDLRAHFDRVKPFYPDATRREGYEVFVVCQGFEQ